MKISLGADHAGFLLKQSILHLLNSSGHEVLDLGTCNTEPVDYPDFARAVGEAVTQGRAERGILVCGSGVGASVAANKIPGIRAGLCHDTFSAHQGVEDDDVNVLCLGARVIGPELALEIVRVWLGAEFSGSERHKQRVAKISELENQLHPGWGTRVIGEEGMSHSITNKSSFNPLLALREQGQSVWYDNISRALMNTGELRNLIRLDGIQGVTSNPTIFEKAILQSKDYVESIKALAGRGSDEQKIYESLVVEDIQRAADLFREVFQMTGGNDGYVSLEVSPRLAYQTKETIAEARRLWTMVNRPNLMIKVPATQEGIPAVEALIGEGINVNITLMFSMDHYIQVAKAYLRGLKRLDESGRPLTVASVASFFVSRVDTLVDQHLEKMLQGRSSQDQKRIADLQGKAAVANTRLVYQKFKEIFSSDTFRSLEQKGARVQRPLWASTSTKNLRYRDVIYVEELIGPNTVNTMPPATINSFRDHGLVRPSLEERLEESQQMLEELATVGIDMDKVTSQLQRDGVKAFGDSFETLMQTISSKLMACKEA